MSFAKINTPKHIVDKLASNPSEHSQQAALFAWSAIMQQHEYPELKWMFAIPNGFYSTAGQKAKMKAEGLKHGVPDIFLPVASHTRGYKGLWIEMKRVKGGIVSDEQKEWGNHLIKQHYCIRLCRGFEEAKQAIIWYLT